MLAEIQCRLICHSDQCFLQCLPVEYVNTHTCKIASGMFRFLFKLGDTMVLICDHDTETACLLNGNRHYRNGNLCIVGLMEVQHDFIIHLINMISGKDQNIFGIVALHIFQVLIDRICSTCIPFTVATLLIGRQYGHTSDIAIQIPGNTDPDMGIQSERLILCQYAYRIHSRINTIRKGKIDNAVLTSKCNGRLGNLGCQNTKTASLSSSQ